MLCCGFCSTACNSRLPKIFIFKALISGIISLNFCDEANLRTDLYGYFYSLCLYFIKYLEYEYISNIIIFDVGKILTYRIIGFLLILLQQLYVRCGMKKAEEYLDTKELFRSERKTCKLSQTNHKNFEEDDIL